MKRTIIFGKWEAIWLMTNLISTKIALGSARVAHEIAGTAAWLLTIYLFILANVLFFIISKLFCRYPGLDISDISREIGGRFCQILVGLIILITLMYTNLIVLREFSEQARVVAFNNSPLSYIMVFFIIGVVVACFLGLETLTRAHAIFVPLLALAFALAGLLTIPKWDPTNILPIFGNGIDKIFLKGTTNISSYVELTFLFMLPPFLGSFKNFQSTGYWAIAISSAAFITFYLAYTFLVPYPTSTENFLPIYQATRLIGFESFFQRAESLFMVFWSLAAFFYISVNLYFTIYLFAKTFNLPYIRPLIIPFAILSYNIAFLPRSLPQTVYTFVNFFYSYAWIVTFILPIILLIASLTFKKGEKSNA